MRYNMKKWRYWFVSIIALLISGIGAYDYIMTLGNNTAYFESLGYGANQIAYFTNYPVPLIILWTLSVWGMVIGALLLPFRLRWSAYALFASVAGQVFLDLITFTFKHRWDVLGAKLGTQDLIILILTIIAAVVVWRYSVKYDKSHI